MALIKQPDVTAWYTSSGTGAHDFAKEAYEEAVKYFEQHLTRDNDKRNWVHSQNSIEDVLKAVQQARDVYQHGDSNTYRAICALSLRVQHYGSILDVLAQHHPEYVALAWGAMKFIFVGVLNHAELVAELSKALFRIADALPTIKLGIALYPTTHMKEVVSRVYAHIMLFLEKATKWYSMSPARRAFSALAKPYSIGYKDTIHQIQLCAESVNLVASAAARAEIRDQTIMLNEQKTKLQELDRAWLDLKKKTQYICDFADASEIKFSHMLHLAEGTSSITSTILTATNDNTNRLRDMQFSRVLDILKPRRIPEDVLHACKIVACRRQLWKNPTPESARFVNLLNSWINAKRSAMFILQAGVRAEARAKDLAIQATCLLRSNRQKVIWNFSERWPNECDLTLSDIIKSLVFQLLVQHPGIAQSEPHLFGVSAYQTQHGEHEWVELLATILTRIPKYFLVVEMENLFERLQHENANLGHVMRVFRDLVDRVQKGGGTLKVLLVCNRLFKADMAGSESTVTLFDMYIRQPVNSVSLPRQRGKRSFRTH